jgi:hypothetical protein
MAIQLAVSTRNARLDAIESDAGVSAILKIRTGAAPADCAAADSGTVLAALSLPADWMAAAAAGAKAKSGTWQDLLADAAGTAAHFRVYKTDGTTCVIQGTCGIGSGDLQLDNTSIAVNQVVTVTAFTLTDGNA